MESKMKRKIFIIFISIFTIALSSDKIFSNSITDIIDNSIRYNDWSEAKKRLENYIKINSTDPKGFVLYAAVLNELKMYDEAIIAARSAINFESSDEKKGEYYFNLGNYYFSKALFDIAFQMYEKSVSLNTVLPNPYYMMGLINYNNKEIEKCIKNWTVYVGLATDALKRDKVKKVIVKLEQFLADEKSRIEAEKRREEEERKKREEYLEKLKKQLEGLDKDSKNLEDYKIKENKKEAEFDELD